MSCFSIILLGVLVTAGEVALFVTNLRRQLQNKQNIRRIVRDRHPDFSANAFRPEATFRGNLAAVKEQNRQLADRAANDHELSSLLANDRRHRIYARLWALVILATTILVVVHCASS